MLNKAFKLKKEAYEIEKSIADKYTPKVISLCKEGKTDEARELISELDWNESIHKFNLIRIIRNCG